MKNESLKLQICHTKEKSTEYGSRDDESNRSVTETLHALQQLKTPLSLPWQHNIPNNNRERDETSRLLCLATVMMGKKRGRAPWQPKRDDRELIVYMATR